MPYGDSTGSSRIEWKSLFLGGLVVLAISYIGVVLPARSQIANLEKHVTSLAATVNALNASQTGVDKANSLLTRLHNQSARLKTAESTIERIEALADRLTADADHLNSAHSILGRMDDFHRSIARQGETLSAAEATLNQVDAVANRAVSVGRTALPAAQQLADLSTILSTPSENTNIAAEHAERLITLENRLTESFADVRTADAALVRLTDLAEMLAGASGTVGQLQRFVVEVMLLEPAVSRAVRALEPMVEFTEVGTRKQSENGTKNAVEEMISPINSATEVARVVDEDSR